MNHGGETTRHQNWSRTLSAVSLGQGDSLSHRMGEGQSEGFLATCVVYPKAQAVYNKIRLLTSAATSLKHALAVFLSLLVLTEGCSRGPEAKDSSPPKLP